LIFVTALLSVSMLAQADLQTQLRAIAAEAHGKVSVACSLPGSSLNCDLNPHAHPPMQSVFKAPLGITVLHLVEQGKFTLDQPVRFLASDRILPHAFSPLQDKYPHGEVDVPLRELLRLAVSESDNVAADILLRIAGGPPAVDAYLKSLGVQGFHIRDGEAAMHHKTALQYRNWFEPAGAVQFLRVLSDHPPCTAEHMELFLGWMKISAKPARIGGMLPAGTVVMHKAGTSDTDHGLTHAWNDIGLIVLPDGRRLAIAVFITDSRAGEAALDPLIARIAKAVYDAASGQ
jgi:beta-lactamase class A